MPGERTKIKIAIDGPAGAGKSTVARKVADALGVVYVDTGAMYRAVTLTALQKGLDPKQDSQKIAELAASLDIRLLPGSPSQKVLADGEDVTEAIRSHAVTASVSFVSQIPEVRRILVKKQQQMAEERGVVMDGRDIGTQVLPQAELKVYLTASAAERARRRYLEIKDKQTSITVEQLEKEISERDRMDAEREVSPLVQAEDAILLDTTSLTIEQAVERIIRLSDEKAGEG